MKVKEQLNKLNRDSSHYTMGLNVFSLISAVLVWAHLTEHLTWWALPITVITILVAWGSEIHSRNKSPTKTVRF